MWRLFVVLALCGASLVQGEEPFPFGPCGMTTMQNVSLTELQGTWVARRLLVKDVRSTETKICMRNEIPAATLDGRFIMTIKSLFAENEYGYDRNRTEVVQLKVIGEEEGRWSVEGDREGGELLVASADPSNYLVLGICIPGRPKEETYVIPREIFRVFFYARRHENGDHSNLSEENLAKIFDEKIKTLGLENYRQHVYEKTDC